MMKRLTLKRVSTSLLCTQGVLIDNEIGLPLMLTLELPYLANQTSISCIPKGIYQCEPYSSKKYPKAYSVQNVPSRTNILFHTGNTVDDIHGCILVGSQYGLLNQKPAVLSSRNAMNQLTCLIGESEFELIVE